MSDWSSDVCSSDLFQGRDRKALRLVDDEDGPHIAAMHVEQEPFPHAENRRLIGFFLSQAEGRRNHAEDTLCLNLRPGYGRGPPAVLRQVVQELIDENGVAGAAPAGANNETPDLPQPQDRTRVV